MSNPKKNKLAIVVGHSEKEPGAKAEAPLNMHEYHYNRGLAYKVQQYARGLGLEAAVFFRDNKTIGMLGREVNSWCFGRNACAIELHFDRYSSETAQGTTTLYDMMPPEGMDLARMVQENVSKVFDRKGKDNRGLRWLKMKDRGYYNLYVLDVPSCIIEPGFGSSIYDCKLLKEREELYAKCLAETAREFLITREGKD